MKSSSGEGGKTTRLITSDVVTEITYGIPEPRCDQMFWTLSLERAITLWRIFLKGTEAATKSGISFSLFWPCNQIKL